MNAPMRTLTFWVILILSILILYPLFNAPRSVEEEVTFSDFVQSVESGRVREVTIQGSEIRGVYQDGGEFKTFSPNDPNLIPLLKEKGVEITAKPEAKEPFWKSFLISLFPILLLIGVWIFFMRQMQVGGGRAMSFGKSRARLLTEHQHKVTFKDVAGIDEAKAELEEVIGFLKDPKKYTKLGGRIPKGVLLVGPPGTGKTLLARAIAGEADVPFFSISGSDFVEMFVGVGASRVRDLFIQGKKHAPCIIFIDEIDAVGRYRGAGLGGGHDEREQTLNQLLVEMDGFESKEGVILIAATNRPDVLDPALLRPGRFDRQVVVPPPDVRGREEILKVHSRKAPLAPNVQLDVIAKGTPGFSGADLENLVNEAALLAARANKESIEMVDFEHAKDKVLMGVERKSLIISEKEKRTTAVHEAGHTLVAKMIPDTDPVHKVSIIPRGRALGITQQLPIEDKYTLSEQAARNSISVLMGGRAAEEIVFGDRTTGAGDDIKKATELARKMVCDWGMSDEIGPLSFGKKDEAIFLGRELAQHEEHSEATAQKIDQEIRKIVQQEYDRAKNILRENRPALDMLAKTLLEREVVEGLEIDKILKEAGSTPASPMVSVSVVPAS